MTNAGIAKAVEARESLVDWNKCQFNWITSFDRRGSWEPCGLKWLYCRTGLISAVSRLVRALWIEITTSGVTAASAMSRLVRALWIEMVKRIGESFGTKSRLVRALWIEILAFYTVSEHDKGRGSWEPCGLKLFDCASKIPRLRRGSWEPCGLKFRMYGTYRNLLPVEARESLVDWNSTTGSWKHLCRLYIFTTHLEILYNSQCYKENIFKREGESCYGKRY